ncbi:MAG: hypothetical protein JRH11_17880, partial [Deltaproteobacteria bacterium]|nr:hypothetical protein [Deltaproteobacteria bacterium]
MGPTVEVLSPAAAADPNVDEIVSSSLTVSCRATPSTAPGQTVDPDSLRILILDPRGVLLADPPVTPVDTETYEAVVDLTTLESGPITVRCEALDREMVPNCGSAEVSTFLDRGPTIEIMTPMDGSFHASRLEIIYRITGTMAGPTDTQSDVVGHELLVAGQTIGSMVETAPGEYVVDIDLDDRVVFPDPLDGARIFSIRAWNGRTPDPVESTVMQNFTVDALGPSITITSPGDGVLVGGPVTVIADIIDTAGVDPATVFLRVGSMDLMMTPVGDTGYTRTFDASGFGRTVVELTLNVVASDIVGNGSAASRNVKLDSTPPYVELDPPLIREGRNVAPPTAGSHICSTLFDPVGSDSANDGEVLGTAAEFRVRVGDNANTSFGGTGTAVFLAGLDPMTVDVYILDNTSVPLLVDLDGDGVCDDINPAVLPGAGGPDTAVVLELLPIAPAGTAFFDEGLDFSAAPSPFTTCTEGTDVSAPAPLCVTTPLSRVIGWDMDSTVATIFGKAPVTASTCVGDAWDFQASITEGSACVAARAVDNLGNVGVSPPLRACFTDGVGVAPCPCSVGSTIPEAMRPTCTDGC